MTRAVDVQDLWVGFRPKSRRGFRRHAIKWAVRDVSFAIARGDVLAVLGGNGSGKSTLLQCLAGVYRPAQGVVSTVGRVASLVDATGFHPELTGRENVATVAQLLGVQRSECREVIEDTIDFAQLPVQAVDSPVRTYSAGMNLRLGLGLVLSVRPDVLLLDEVLAVGDEAFQRRGWERVRELCASGSTVVVVTHRLEQVEEHCDRALVLDQGTALFCGTAKQGLECYLASGGRTPPPPPWAAHLSD